MPMKSEGAMKISVSRASELRRAPTWHSSPTTPKSLSGQPLNWVWIRRSRGWPERDFGVIIQQCHVGARFEALEVLVCMGPWVLPCIFTSQEWLPEHSVIGGGCTNSKGIKNRPKHQSCGCSFERSCWWPAWISWNCCIKMSRAFKWALTLHMSQAALLREMCPF